MSFQLPRHAEVWLPGYVAARLGALAYRAPGEGATLWVAVCDHFEPFWKNTNERLARDRVGLWVERWPRIAERCADSSGCPPKYSFFYPQEEYRDDILERLAGLVRQGIADVEIHIHHDNDGEAAFRAKMLAFREALHHRHGLLRRQGGDVVFGFIHGNWALDNSRPDGRWCGLNNELTILSELGCYADFTMPSGASPTQARKVNAIYWAQDDPKRAKSYDSGVDLLDAAGPSGLLMIPGPLGLRWKGRLMPRMEAGEIAGYDMPTAYRARRWAELAPRVGNHIFLKLHTHGTQERNSGPLLGGGLESLYKLIGAECKRRGWRSRFVSAWEMYLAVMDAARALGRDFSALTQATQ